MNNERMYKVILGAHISEKATIVAEDSDQITFKVVKNATRQEIREAVEKIYKVEVKNVTVMNVKGKVKRTFRGLRRKPNWKKAYVRLEEGYDIDFGSIN